MGMEGIVNNAANTPIRVDVEGNFQGIKSREFQASQLEGTSSAGDELGSSTDPDADTKA